MKNEIIHELLTLLTIVVGIFCGLIIRYSKDILEIIKIWGIKRIENKPNQPS